MDLKRLYQPVWQHSFKPRVNLRYIAATTYLYMTYMPNNHCDTDVSFRFLKLDKLQALTLKHEIVGADYLQHRDGHYIGIISLQESVFEDLITFFVRQQIPLANCDIYICTGEQPDNQSFAVPMTVNKLLKHIDCQLTICIDSA